uniref:Uncharacterized protein n=1 Tax=Arundo donax TaxID=35708 RepID=A0A0A8YRP1_ARUDO
MRSKENILAAENKWLNFSRDHIFCIDIQRACLNIIH